MQQASTSLVIITPARACADCEQAGIKAGGIVYLAWDQDAGCFYVVQWNRTRWLCSCGKGGCRHRLAANQYVFDVTQRAGKA